jgi:hypothetical protein
MNRFKFRGFVPLFLVFAFIMSIGISPTKAQIDGSESPQKFHVTGVPQSAGEMAPTQGLDLKKLGVPETVDFIMGDLKWLPLKLDLEQVVISGRSVLKGMYATNEYGKIGVYIDQNDSVFYDVGGHLVGPLPIESLRELPGGKEEASAGASWCWDIPVLSDILDGPVQITVVGHGSSLTGAVADFKNKVAALKSIGWRPVPCPPSSG